MNKNPRSKKLALKVDTIRLLEGNRLSAVQGGGTTTVATIIFTEGACEGFSWWRAC